MRRINLYSRFINLQAICGFSLLGIVSPAYAATSLATSTLALTSTFECISVEAKYTGDDNASATAIVEYKRNSSTTWLPAYTAFIDRRATISGNANTAHVREARVSIVGLQPNTGYDVRVRWNDSDGVSGPNPVVGTVPTLNPTPPTGGTTRYVDSAASAGGNGTSGSPWNSLATAETASAPGDTMMVKGQFGPYTFAKSGTATAWRKWIANGSCSIGGGTASCNVYASYVWFSGITFRQALRSSLYIGSNNHHILVDSCSFPNISSDTNPATSYGGSGVFGENGSSHIYVRNCSFTTSGHGYNDGIFAVALGGSPGANGTFVVTDNTVSGPFRDGISAEGNGWGSGFNRNSDIARNQISGCLDDGIEVDGDDCNTRVWGNDIDCTNSSSGLSVAGCNLGPVYVFRNTIHGTSGVVAVKQGNISPGPAYFFHNSINVSGSSNADGFSDIGGSTLSELHTYINNVVTTTRYGVYRGGRSNVYDYNLWSPATWLVDEWNGSGSFKTLANWKAAQGQEAHGLQGLAGFIGNTLQIAVGSIAIDRGVVLPNFNDQNSAWPYAGTGPDIGYLEVGLLAVLRAPYDVTTSITVGP